MGVLPIIDNLPFHVAVSESIFVKNKLKVELVPFQSALERDTAMRAGAIDGMLTDLVSAVLLEATGCDISIVSVGLGASPSEGRFALVASPKTRINTIKDLKGVKVGISSNTIIEYVLDRLLASNGLKPGSVGKLDVPKLPVRTEMLLSGQLKACVLPDPMAAYALSRGAKLIDDDTDESISQTVILFRKEFVDRNAEQITRLMKAYADAVNHINADKEAYRNMLADIAGIPTAIKLTYEMDRWPRPQMVLDSDIAAVVDWMLAKGLIRERVASRRLCDGRFLPDADGK